MNIDHLRHQFNLTSKALEYNIEDITDEESLADPTGGGNCINWVVGHIITTRDEMFQDFQCPRVLPDPVQTRYERGSEPVRKGDQDIIPLTRLRESLKKSNTIVWEMLDKIERGELKPNVEHGINLAGFSFHEAYHVGQTAILRRFLGKEGVIK